MSEWVGMKEKGRKNDNNVTREKKNVVTNNESRASFSCFRVIRKYVWLDDGKSYFLNWLSWIWLLSRVRRIVKVSPREQVIASKTPSDTLPDIMFIAGSWERWTDVIGD